MSDDEKQMLANLDLLMNMDIVENENDWDVLDSLEENDENGFEEADDQGDQS